MGQRLGYFCYGPILKREMRTQKIIDFFLGVKHPQKFQVGDRVSFVQKFTSTRETQTGLICSFEQGRGPIQNYYQVSTSFLSHDERKLKIGIPEGDLTLLTIHTLE